MAALGESYLNGSEGLPMDTARAHLWLRRAADEGWEPAKRLLVH